MQIRVEVEVTPEELRRFLGLPDVTGLQDDIVAFLRDKVGAASEFDASAFLKANLDALKRNELLNKIVARVRVTDPAKADEKPAPKAARPRKRKTAAQ
ncbi:MAG TPA: DUF6489 family protein [Nevskiaceae bacterium]|nr:DUF6489 family protein [Nevskiaceae bacterium]